MLSIFIPQEKLEDIVIDNMASTMEPEEQDTWFKIFIKQDFIYVSSWDEKKYFTQEDPLFLLSDSYGVEIRYATQYIESIPEQPESVLNYWNGIFLLNISKEDAATIQRNYGVICQSVDHMNYSVLLDSGLRFSPEKKEKGYSWEIILRRISAQHIPSNHLILVDRYLFASKGEMESALDNIYEIMDTMLPTHPLKCTYKVTLIIGQQKEGEPVSLSEMSKKMHEMIPNLKRTFRIDTEVIYLTYQSGLYTASHNRCILTNYTITQLEHKLNAFENEISTCLQTILPQRLFTMVGLDGYCDSPYKTHHDVMAAIYNNLVWWINNYSTPTNVYSLNGEIIDVKEKYRTQKTNNFWYIFERK